MTAGCVGICSFGMFTAPGTSYSITPTSTVKLGELSDMEQSAYTSTSSAIISTSRKKHILVSYNMLCTANAFLWIKILFLMLMVLCLMFMVNGLFG